MKQVQLDAKHLKELAPFIRQVDGRIMAMEEWCSGQAGTDGPSNGIKESSAQSTSRARTLATFLISSRGIAAVVSVAVCTLSLRRDGREEIAICGPLPKLISRPNDISDVRPNLR